MATISASDTSSARNNMVDSQVRPNKVTDPRIIAAMRSLPRESFLPASVAARLFVAGKFDIVVNPREGQAPNRSILGISAQDASGI